MSSEGRWRECILARFPSRQTVPDSAVFQRVWAELGVPRAEAMGVLELLHREYGIAPGFFRPDDSLGWLFEPVNDGSFLSRAMDQVRSADSQLELDDHLKDRCKAHGVPIPTKVTTLGEFVRACSGTPNAQ